MKNYSKDKPVASLAVKDCLCREVWWKYPPQPGLDDVDIEWGFLEIYNDGTCAFIEDCPSDDEIANRRCCWLHEET